MPCRVQRVAVTRQVRCAFGDSQIRQTVPRVVRVAVHHSVGIGHRLQVAHVVVTITRGVRPARQIAVHHRAQPVQGIVRVGNVPCTGGDSRQVPRYIIAVLEKAHE